MGCGLARFQFSQTGKNESLTGALTAASGVVGPFRYRREPGDREWNQVHLILAGTWVGTMALQVSYPDAERWVTESNGTFTSNTSLPLSYGGSCDIRVLCSAYTSGTCYASLAGV